MVRNYIPYKCTMKNIRNPTGALNYQTDAVRVQRGVKELMPTTNIV